MDITLSLYKNRCQCKEINKKEKKTRTSKKLRQGKPFEYPESDESSKVISKTFEIKYEKKLSTIAKLLLNSFHNKYLYYAMDDILYSFQSNSDERDNLLAIISSPVLSLQNNFSINFFDIWIHEIYIHEVSKVNKFLTNDSLNLEPFSYITIKLLYKTGVPIKKPDPLW